MIILFRCYHKLFYKLLRMFYLFFSCIIIRSTYVLLITLCFIIITFTLITFSLYKLDVKIYFYCSVKNWWVKHEVHTVMKFESCVFFWNKQFNLSLSYCWSWLNFSTMWTKNHGITLLKIHYNPRSIVTKQRISSSGNSNRENSSRGN